MIRFLIILLVPVTAAFLFSSLNFNNVNQNLDLRKLLTYRQLPHRCRLPSYPGYNPRNPFFTINMYYFNAQTGRCETFGYSGRGGNRNRYRSPVECLSRCACHMPVDPGTCHNSTTGITRYYYNKVFKMCASFQFNGCEGNDNNFADFMSCQLACGRSGGGGEIEL